MSRARLTLIVAVAMLGAGLALGVSSAQAGVLLAEADAASLAQDLADAQAEQGVCYGWNVYVSDTSSGSTYGGGYEVGSSDGGPGTQVNVAGCDKWVVLTGSVRWVADSCECEDSVSMQVTSNGLAAAPTIDDLDELGLGQGELLGNKEDQSLYSMVAALPLLTSESGVAVPVPDEPVPINQVPASDTPTNSPIVPDFLRDHFWRILLLGFLICVGAYMAFDRVRSSVGGVVDALDDGDGNGDGNGD